MTNDMNGLVAIVTGAAAKKGIGFACAQALTSRGASIVISDHPKMSDDLNKRVSELTGSGINARAMLVDITEKEKVDSAVANVLDDMGRVDILVNNAGIGVGSGEFLDQSEAEWDLTLTVNVKGTVNLSKAVLPAMVKEGSGTIVNISSLCGLRNIPPVPPAYTASKFALIGVTKAIAQEFAPQGIRCNAVCPGVVETGMRVAFLKKLAAVNGITEAEADKEERATISMGRPADPEEIGRAVAFLASPEASYVTGIAMPVDGGLTFGL